MRLSLKVNNEQIEADLAAPTLSGLLAFLSVIPAHVVVELNGELYKEGDFEGMAVKEGDMVEVLHFMGGGY